jgi:hypothetical protein
MLGFDDLKAEIAPCWKLVWNVEPAPLIVPLAVAALADVLAAGELAAAEAGAELEDDDEDEHAARAMAAATAPLAATTCLPRNCIRNSPCSVSFSALHCRLVRGMCRANRSNPYIHRRPR